MPVWTWPPDLPPPEYPFWPGQLQSVDTTILAGATFNWDINLSAVPNNAAAIVQIRAVAFTFQPAAPGIQSHIAGQALAGRRDNGSLVTASGAYDASIVIAGNDPLASVGNLSIPTPNELRIEVVCAAGQDCFFAGRALIGIVQSPLPLG